jgi:DNA-binding NtrC family response regulator
MSRLPQILICDDDQVFHLAVKHSLKGRYEFRSAFNAAEAVTILKKQQFELLVLDIQMRTEDEGLKHIPVFREIDPDLSIVMSSSLKDFATVREAMRLGANDYVPKDFDPDELAITFQQVLEKRALLKRNAQQNFEAVTNQKHHVMIGECPEIVALRKTIERVRASNANVVITGETGTGKEVVARQLRGVNADGSLAPFVAVDSSTIQSTMAESMLFGHEKGAFTGAERSTAGIFEEANGGIVYFDEIVNMPLDIQAKLLRVLQEKEVTRLGSSRTLQLEFRVVCATNQDLDEMARNGKFKADLLQRLNVIPIQLPPLKARKSDIPLLLAHYADRNRAGGKRVSFTPEALELLQSYPWPGNIRELSNLVSYLTVMTDGTELDVADLPPKIRDQAVAAGAGGATYSVAGGTFYEKVSEFEKQVLKQAYQDSQGNVSRLALTMGMDRSHLYSKLKQYGIHGEKRPSDK